MINAIRIERNRDEAYVQRVEKIAINPVFIMGLHRSGTTLLYELMGMTGMFNVLTAYHALCYDSLLANHFEGCSLQERQKLNDWFASLNMETRLIDNVKLNADMPEEFGMVIHPRCGTMRVTPTSFPFFQQICRKVQITSDLSKILLLKNPWDFDGFLFLKSKLPQAKFIFIHRHPIHILDSQLKALHTYWSSPNPYISRLSHTYSVIQNNFLLRRIFRKATDPSSKIPLLQIFLGLKISLSMKKYIQDISSLPLSSYMSLRYEDLCENPKQVFKNIYEFVNLDPQQDLPFERHIQPRPFKLHPALAGNLQAINKRFEECMAYHGYSQL
jgi:hypothetical protein